MRRLTPTNLALIAGAALLLILGFLLLRGGDEDQDKLTGNESSTAAADDPEKRCSSKATYDLIKRELFRRAAQVRGSDQALFNRLAGYAALRMERPVLESEDEEKRQVSCSGSLSLDLPPGVAVVGGRRTLTSDVDYSLQRAADGSGDVLTLSNADAIITPLATLARTAPGTSPPLNPADPTYNGPGEMVPPNIAPMPAPAPSPPPPPAPEPQRPDPLESASARPSFNCANARTRGELAVCRDSGLAALDRQMASQFNQAMGQAGPGERVMLDRTRTRFLTFRDRCGTDDCIADAYRGRVAEIRDIMSGQWAPPR
ncbi:MAG: hypothetical protein ABIO43_06320 [Sphingomicrobium sp.]